MSLSSFTDPATVSIRPLTLLFKGICELCRAESSVHVKFSYQHVLRVNVLGNNTTLFSYSGYQDDLPGACTRNLERAAKTCTGFY